MFNNNKILNFSLKNDDCQMEQTIECMRIKIQRTLASSYGRFFIEKMSGDFEFCQKWNVELISSFSNIFDSVIFMNIRFKKKTNKTVKQIDTVKCILNNRIFEQESWICLSFHFIHSFFFTQKCITCNCFLSVNNGETSEACEAINIFSSKQPNI